MRITKTLDLVQIRRQKVTQEDFKLNMFFKIYLGMIRGGEQNDCHRVRHRVVNRFTT